MGHSGCAKETNIRALPQFRRGRVGVGALVNAGPLLCCDMPARFAWELSNGYYIRILTLIHCWAHFRVCRNGFLALIFYYAQQWHQVQTGLQLTLCAAIDGSVCVALRGGGHGDWRCAWVCLGHAGTAGDRGARFGRLFWKLTPLRWVGQMSVRNGRLHVPKLHK